MTYKHQRCLSQTTARRRVVGANVCRLFGVASQTELSNNFIYILYMYVLFVVIEKRRNFQVFSGGLLNRANETNTALARHTAGITAAKAART